MNQDDDDMSNVTGFTGTIGNTFFTQDKRIDIPEEFGHAVDKFQIESKKKGSVAASWHLQDYMDAIKHQPSRW